MNTGTSIIARVLKRVLCILHPGIRHELHCGMKTVNDAIVDLWNAVIETQNVVNKNAEEMEHFEANVIDYIQKGSFEIDPATDILTDKKTGARYKLARAASIIETIFDKINVIDLSFDGVISANGGTVQVSSLTWSQKKTTRYSDGSVVEEIVVGDLNTPGVSVQYVKLEGDGEVDVATGAVTAQASTNAQPCTAAVVMPRVTVNGVTSDDADSKRVTVMLGAAYLEIVPNTALSNVTSAGGTFYIGVNKSAGAQVMAACDGATEVSFDASTNKIKVVIPSGAEGRTFALRVGSNLSGWAEKVVEIMRKPHQETVMRDHAYYGYVTSEVRPNENTASIVMAAFNANAQVTKNVVEQVAVHEANTHTNVYGVSMPEMDVWPIAYFLLPNNGYTQYKMVNCQGELGGDQPIESTYGYVDDQAVTVDGKQYRLFAFASKYGGEDFDFGMVNKN